MSNQKIMKITKLIAVAALTLSSAGAFAAATDRSVVMDFNSGAQFSGVVTFAADYSSLLGVAGTLTGYQPTATGYIGSGSTTINWIWSTYNFATAANTYGNFLMDNGVTFGNYANWIAFTYDYSNPSNLTFSSSGYGNMIDYADPMRNGVIAAVPEPETYAMLLAGLGLLGFTARRRKDHAA